MMLRYCFQMYLMLHIIIKLNNKSAVACNILPKNARENETTQVLAASNILTVISQENVPIEVVEASNILPGISHVNRTTNPLDSNNNILPGISEENGTTEIVGASNILTDIFQENGTKENVQESNILTVILQENGPTEEASSILPGISQENGTTEKVEASNNSTGISEENGTTEIVEASNILTGLSKENETAAILTGISEENITTGLIDASEISPGISQEHESAKVVDAYNIFHGVAGENGTTEVDEPNIFSNILQENGTAEIVDASNILSENAVENGTTEVVDASNILPNITEENETTEVIDAANILPGIFKENGTTVVYSSNIFSENAEENGTTKVVNASNILFGDFHENGTTEILETSDILPGIVQENQTAGITDLLNILPSFSKEKGITENVHDFNISPNKTQENVTTEVVEASNILPAIAQEKETTKLIDASSILPKQNFESLKRSCYDLRKLGGVCSNSNLTIIKPSYGVKGISELIFNDTRFLPARALFGLSIQRVVVDDPNITVDEDVFYGMVHLYTFYVEQSNIKVIPDFRNVKDTIENITIQSSSLTSLEGNNLQNLTMIFHLNFTRNSIQFIHPDVFKGTDDVLMLDLSYNLLTSIPPNLLDPMKNLCIFSADHNNLLHVDNLFKITQPEDIYLDSNNITDFTAQIFMKAIETLDLSENPLKNFRMDALNIEHSYLRETYKLRVKHLHLEQCRIKKFNNGYFYGLRGLETLDLNYNLIEEDYDAYAEEFTRDGTIIAELGEFDLSGNKLRSISKILKYKKITNLFVAKNQIQYLTDEDFRFVHQTEYLELRENQIRRIDTDTFQPLRRSLTYLDLSSNSITSLNGSITHLSQLIKLYLPNNLIQSFGRDEFSGLNELSELYLEHNHIKALWQFKQLPYLECLNITDNDIEVIKEDHVPEMLDRIYLAGNTLECNCRLQPFLLQCNAEGSFVTDIDVCPHYIDKISNCPGMCSCGCTNNGDDHFISVDCSSKSLSVVPEFLRKGLTVVGGNKTMTSEVHNLPLMKQTIYPSFDLEDRVLGVNLENNSLESLEDILLPTDLIQLYLANNKLKRLPDTILENQVNLKNVSLSGNPWNCDCDALKFKRWLTSLRHDTIQDIDSVRCGTSDKGESTLNGRVIGTLTELELCPKHVGVVVSVSIGVLTFVTLCLTTMILYKKYELNVKVFLYSRGFTFVKEKNIDYDKVFDAFLSFCHQDDKFVIEEIIPVIEERDPTLHLCIHYRHFMAGEYIYDNIIWAVRNSKRTVLILSKNFLESEWCLMEFRTAHMQTLEDKVHRIIVIKVGDLPKEMDPAIKAYLNSTTYLTWGEKNFWNKLLYVLPTGSCVKNRLQEI